jgi:hypothetical protein
MRVGVRPPTRRGPAALLVFAALVVGCRIESRRTVDSADDARAVASASEHACGSPVIDSAGVGRLRIGATVDSVQAHCTVLRDSTELRAEGLPARILVVPIGGDTVEAEVVDGRVWRIAVVRPTLRTRDSVGVGSPLAALLTIPELRGTAGEGALFAMSPARCGLSFQLSSSDRRADGWTIDRLRRLPPSTIVQRVLVVGCAETRP